MFFLPEVWTWTPQQRQAFQAYIPVIQARMSYGYDIPHFAALRDQLVMGCCP
jgi:hypothetical protein